MNVFTNPRHNPVANTAGLAKALQVKAEYGQLSTARISNLGASTVYIQYHDVASTPADGRVPEWVFPLNAGGAYVDDVAFDFGTGCYICGSSTAGTKTLIAGNDLSIRVSFC